MPYYMSIQDISHDDLVLVAEHLPPISARWRLKRTCKRFAAVFRDPVAGLQLPPLRVSAIKTLPLSAPPTDSNVPSGGDKPLMNIEWCPHTPPPDHIMGVDYDAWKFPVGITFFPLFFTLDAAGQVSFDASTFQYANIERDVEQMLEVGIDRTDVWRIGGGQVCIKVSVRALPLLFKARFAVLPEYMTPGFARLAALARIEESLLRPGKLEILRFLYEELRQSLAGLEALVATGNPDPGQVVRQRSLTEQAYHVMLGRRKSMLIISDDPPSSLPELAELHLSALCKMASAGLALVRLQMSTCDSDALEASHLVDASPIKNMVSAGKRNAILMAALRDAIETLETLKARADAGRLTPEMSAELRESIELRQTLQSRLNRLKEKDSLLRSALTLAASAIDLQDRLQSFESRNSLYRPDEPLLRSDPIWGALMEQAVAAMITLSVSPPSGPAGAAAPSTEDS